MRQNLRNSGSLYRLRANRQSDGARGGFGSRPQCGPETGGGLRGSLSRRSRVPGRDGGTPKLALGGACAAIHLAFIGRVGRRARSRRRPSSSSATWVYGVAGKPEALVAYARGAPGARVDSPGPSCVVDSFRVGDIRHARRGFCGDQHPLFRRGLGVREGMRPSLRIQHGIRNFTRHRRGARRVSGIRLAAARALLGESR